MKLLGSTEEEITKNKNGENVPWLEFSEVFLVHCNIVNNQYQHDARFLSIFVPSKSLDQLINILPTNHIYMATFHSEFHTLKYGLLMKTPYP